MSDGVVIWLFGLSGSGKSTIAGALADRFQESGLPVEQLDGDSFRPIFCNELGFSKEDRMTNIRRAEAVARLLARHGIHVIASFITPYEEMRAYVRKRIPRLVEVFVDCPLPVCAARDPKGLYRKTNSRELLCFTGVDDPFERPNRTDVTLPTDRWSVEACLSALIEHLRQRQILLK